MAKPPFLERVGTAIAALGGAEFKAGTDGYMQELLQLLTYGRQSKSGVAVNVETALQVSTVFACVRVVAEGLGQMPCKMQRRYFDGRREPARDLPLYRVLYRRANDWQTAFEFREQMLYHAMLTGNGYAYINRDGAGQVTELLPLTPNRVRIRQNTNAVVTYDVMDAKGAQTTLKREEVFHLRGPSWNGVEGMDAVRLARESIGLAISAENSQADLHRNGMQTTGIISMDAALKDTARERLKERLKEFRESDQVGVLILDQAAKFHSMAMTGVDGQHLETRRLQIEEICRGFRVFPQMIGHAERTATYASAEQFFMAHVVHSLGPWVERWDQAVERDLIADDVDAGKDFELVAKLAMQGLMRGDATTRAAFYASGIVNRWLVPNEAREFEDLPRIEGGDESPPVQGAAPAAAPGRAPAKADPKLAKAIAQDLMAEFGTFTDLATLETKIGRALSASNENRLRDARALLDEVLTTIGADAA